MPLGVEGGNRTDWASSGGSLKLDLHHPWTYVFVNLGLGPNVTNFNYTLTPAAIWNVTGNGTFCVPSLKLPSGLSPSDGQLATIQVVTLGDSGSALYNCADITFRANVSAYGGEECKTSAGVTAAAINGAGDGSSTGNSTGGGSGANNTAGGGAGRNAGSASGVSVLALTAALGFAVVFSAV